VVVVVLNRIKVEDLFSMETSLRLFDDSIGRRAGRKKVFEHRFVEKRILLLLFVNEFEIQIGQIRVRRGEHCFYLEGINGDNNEEEEEKATRQGRKGKRKKQYTGTHTSDDVSMKLLRVRSFGREREESND
jgi:hypothetical protein